MASVFDYYSVAERETKDHNSKIIVSESLGD